MYHHKYFCATFLNFLHVDQPIIGLCIVPLFALFFQCFSNIPPLDTPAPISPLLSIQTVPTVSCLLCSNETYMHTHKLDTKHNWNTCISLVESYIL